MKRSADLPSPRSRRKIPPPEPERLVVIGLRCSRSYYISQDRPVDIPVGDEAILTVRGQIAEASARHRKHVGREVEISLCCARSFVGHEGQTKGKPFLLYMNLRKDQCSLMAYLPSDAFWSLPALISGNADTCVELRFEPLHYGSGSLLSLWFGSPEELPD